MFITSNMSVFKGQFLSCCNSNFLIKFEQIDVLTNCINMDKHLAGPHDCTILTRQAKHRSSLLWDGPPEGQVCTCPKSLQEKIVLVNLMSVCM